MESNLQRIMISPCETPGAEHKEEEVDTQGARQEGNQATKTPGDQHEGAPVTHQNTTNKILKNQELFEKSINDPSVIAALNVYDRTPESLMAFKMMYQQLEQENFNMKNHIRSLDQIIESGSHINKDMKDHITNLTKALEACDLKTAEILLEENVRLKNKSEELEKQGIKNKQDIKVLEEVIAELTKDKPQLQKAQTETEENNTNAGHEDTEVAEEETGAEPNDDNISSEAEEVINLVNMKNSGHERVNPQTAPIKKVIVKNSNEGQVFKCDVCKLVCDKKEKLERHMKNHDEDGDWTCDGCSYQSNEQNDLLNHLLEKRNHSTILLDHLLNKNVYDRRDKCTLCGEMFGTKTDLHSHLNLSHKTYKPCNRMPECTGEDCRFNHAVVSEGAHLCYQCGDEFSSRMGLMNHMKANHEMPPCKHYQNGKCTFRDRCWYSHTGSNQSNATSVPKPQTALGFWDARATKDPPTQNISNQQKMINTMMQLNQQMMKEVMSQMNQNMMNMIQNLKN